MILKLTQLWSLLLATRAYITVSVWIGVHSWLLCHASKEGVSSVDQDSKIIAGTIGNELMCDDGGKYAYQGM